MSPEAGKGGGGKLTPEKVFLVGFMGSGKTTIGALLALRLDWPFVDIDQEIQRIEQKSIGEIFRSAGEPYFRRVESRILREIPPGGPLVVATGGGTFTREENIRLIEDRGLSVWLRCPLERILQRCQGSLERPLMGGQEQVRELLRQREVFYRRARLHLDTVDAAPEEIVEQILTVLPRRCF